MDSHHCMIIIVVLLSLSEICTSKEGSRYLDIVTVKKVTFNSECYISVSVTISDDGATPTLGQSYILSCLVSGEQSEDDLTYQWLKNGTMRSETIDTIAFPSLRLSDSGLYTCNVTVNSTMSYSGTIDITLQCKFQQTTF